MKIATSGDDFTPKGDQCPCGNYSETVPPRCWQCKQGNSGTQGGNVSKERIIQAALAALPKSEVVTATNIGRIVDSVFESIAGDVANGWMVQIGGFGTFKVKDRAARKARNPQTGAEIDVPASRTVTFKPAAKLKARL